MAAAPRILIVEARFYQDIADELVAGAYEVLGKSGASVDRIAVPGAFEIPAAIAMAEQGGDVGGGPFYHGYVALGCVIRGETSHYDYVCGESARGLQLLAIERTLAIGYGILTTETREQAWKRASRADGDKGADAARACLAMLGLRRRFGIDP